jgi:riboflavin kinase/FMN adenylyltransferase
LLTIGNFDGVHRGHQSLLARVVARAAELDAPATVYTFDPPPRVVLDPGRHPPRILSLSDKVRLLAEVGVARVVVESFDRAFARNPASWFIDEVLSRRLRPVELCVGHDFRFGRGREGNAALVRARLPDLPFLQLPAEREGDDIISSSRIREAVARGEVALATRMMGRCHRLAGVVVAGDGRGRTLGVPTANVDVETELLPARGVYAVRLTDESGSPALGVANLGVRPTFDGRTYTVEVHLLDFCGDLYGHRVTVDLVQRIRGERRFNSVDQLVERIRMDIRAAREILAL